MRNSIIRADKKSRSVSILLVFALVFSSLGAALGTFGNYVKAANPIVIMDAAGLDDIRNDLTGDYILGANIHLDDAPYNVNEGWEPIGSSSNPFEGSLNGNGFTISGLTINRPAGDDIGLFGRTSAAAKLSKIKLEDVTVTGRNKVGGLVGHIFSENSFIENSSVSGIVKGTGDVGGVVGFTSGTIERSSSGAKVSGDMNIGGLVGYANGRIIDSYATGDVTGRTNIGGLIGWVGSKDSIISGSKASGSVEGTIIYAGGLVGHNYGRIESSLATGSVKGISYTGGLVGMVSQTGIIFDSEASGNVEGTVNYTGGFVGYHSGTIEKSFATGSVSGNGDSGGLVGTTQGSILKSYASGNVSGNVSGGLVGRQFDNSKIEDTYSTGTVHGKEDVGGLVGRDQGGTIKNSYAIGLVTTSGNQSQASGLVGIINDTETNIVNSFFDSQTTNQSDDDGRGLPKTTAEMQNQAIFTNWNFIDIWEIPTGDYPRLQWGTSPSKEIISVESLADKTVVNGTNLNGVGLPNQVKVTLDDTSTVNLDVTWDGGTPAYNGNIAGTYEFKGQLTLDANVINPTNISTTVKVTVLPRQVIPPNPGGGGGVPIKSSDTSLKILEIFDATGSGIQLTPSFSKDVYQYEVETSEEQVELKIESTHTAAQVMVQGVKVGQRKLLDLVIGKNEFVLTVKAEDGSTKNYKLNIYRTEEKQLKPTPPHIQLTDIKGHWAEEVIKHAVSDGIVRGHANGQFKPNDTINRAEFTVMLANALKLKEAETNYNFKDQHSIGSWAKESVNMAVNEGIVLGFQDNTFRPHQLITRLEMISMVARALKLPQDAKVTGFADDAIIPAWAKGGVEASRVKGIIKGRGNNRFDPSDRATRAEALVVIMRMIEIK